MNLLFLRETRGDVLLSRRAKRLTKLTGRRHYCASDLQKKSFMNVLRVSLVRPFGKSQPHPSGHSVMRLIWGYKVYLSTEPIVTALSIWIGFAWACLFLSTASTLLVFGQYGWNVGQLGSIQACVSPTVIVACGCRLKAQVSWCWSYNRLPHELSSRTSVCQEG